MKWWSFLFLFSLMGCASLQTGSMVVVPSFTGALPDGTEVYGIVVVPTENVTKGEAWKMWETQWPAKYQLLHRRHD